MLPSLSQTMTRMAAMLRSLLACAAVLRIASGNALGACEAPASSDPHYRLTKLSPVQGDDVRLVSGFGLRLDPLHPVWRMHTGVDWSAPKGAPVVATEAGRIASAATDARYGKIVVIDHGDGLATAYAHLSRIDVREGDCVTSGAIVGAAGSTGLTTKTGVHFEVRRNGKFVDPMLDEARGR